MTEKVSFDDFDDTVWFDEGFLDWLREKKHTDIVWLINAGSYSILRLKKEYAAYKKKLKIPRRRK